MHGGKWERESRTIPQHIGCRQREGALRRKLGSKSWQFLAVSGDRIADGLEAQTGQGDLTTGSAVRAGEDLDRDSLTYRGEERPRDAQRAIVLDRNFPGRKQHEQRGHGKDAFLHGNWDIGFRKHNKTTSARRHYMPWRLAAILVRGVMAPLSEPECESVYEAELRAPARLCPFYP